MARLLPGNMSPEAADHYVALLEFGAAAMHYVTQPGVWAGYVAFMEQHVPTLDPLVSREEVRQMMAGDAIRFGQIAQAARGELQ
jgi:hypothetical protein